MLYFYVFIDEQDPARPPHPPHEWKIGSYGQNMAWNFATPEDAIRAWFEEYIVSFYSFISIKTTD